MKLTTTCIGAFPKPAYVRLPDWFNQPEGPDTANPTAGWAGAMAAMGREAESILTRATAEVVADQIQAGIDIPTDGEISRENYIHYHCRHLDGISFDELTRRSLRNDAYSADLPTVTGPVSPRIAFLVRDWRRAQSCTDRPVKMTMPGPMTISDTTADNFYHDPVRLSADLADALNTEVRALADAGCRYIQIDEPLFARKPREALDYGIENLERAFYGCPASVMRTVHMCCGYPDRVDNPDYPKADPGAYRELATAVEESSVQAVSLEDAHRPNDLSLLERFKETTVILGVVAIARSRIEEVGEIRERLRAALQHIEPARLMVAPDCGLGLLSRKQALAKLRNLCDAAHDL